jgi:hypothetical protein
MPSYSDWQEVSFGGGFFVAPIYNSRFAAVSSDGINWETLDLGKVASWTSIGYGARGFSVVSSGTDSDLVDVSIKDKFKLRTSSIDAVDAIASYDSGGKATQVSYSPGSTWSTVGSQSLAFSGKVAYGKNVFVIMSTSTGTSAAVSSNGVNWTSSPMPVSSSWSVITYGSGLFAAFTGGTVYATSPDGWTWTQRSLTTTNGVASVVYGGGQFVALSSSSTEGFTSPDGINWTQRTLPSAKIWTALAYGNGVYVASSGNGSQGVITSPDGVTWTERTPPFMGRTLVFGNGVFVMVPAGSTSTAATSTDGITWTTVTLPVTAWYGAATYANGLFVLGSISQNATILTSTDGSNWTVASSSYYVNDLTYGNGKFLGTQYSSYGIIVSEG